MAQSHLLLATHLRVSKWTLATVTMITCNFAWQSPNSIVPTLVDFTLVISITLMCPVHHTPHALMPAQPACCASHCSMGTTSLHSNKGGHGRSAPTIVTPLVAQQILCTFHSASNAKTQRVVQNNDDEMHWSAPSYFPITGASFHCML